MSFLALGRAVYRWRWGVVAVWAVLLAVCLPLAPRAGSALKVGGFSNGSIESARARAALEEGLGFHASVLLVIFRHPDWTADDPRFVGEVERALADVRTLPGVVQVVEHWTSPRQIGEDRHTAYELLVLDLTPTQFQRILPTGRLHLSDRAELLERGIEFLDEIQRADDGNCWSHFRAPDGHVYELTEQPGHPAHDT